VADCRTALTEPDRVPAIRDVLERIARTPGDVVAAVGEPDEGGIGVIHHADDLTVLNVVWTPGMHMPPHDHLMLAAITVYGGREDNDFYRRGDEGVVPSGGRAVTAGEVLVLGEEAVHGVRGHPDRYTGGIHVYAGDFFNRVRSMWSAEDGHEIKDPPPTEDIFSEAERRWRAASR
jgi:predicted metal-dependent enzyme (double-stranded beta helix superfamily)